MNFKTIFTAAAIALIAPISAQAATIDFRAPGGNTGLSSLTFDFLGVTDAILVQGFNETGGDANINQNDSGQGGLGVVGSPEGGRLASTGGSSGIDGAESLVISFSQALIDQVEANFGAFTVTQLFLTDAGSDTDGETFVLQFNDGPLSTEFQTTNNNGNFFDVSFTFASASDTLTIFGTSDDDGIGGGPGNQGVRLQSLSIVPLPAPALLLLTGIAGLGFAMRRRAS